MGKLIGLGLLQYICCWLPGLCICAFVISSSVLLRILGLQSTVYNVAIVGLSSVAASIIMYCFLKSKSQDVCRVQGDSKVLQSIMSK